MRQVIIRINNLIDQHGDNFEKCKGCPTCIEIKRLYKQIERAPVDKFKHILEKGQGMKKSDIVFLLDNEVKKSSIRKALGFTKVEFWDLLDNFGLLKKSSRREKGMAKLSLEEYLKYKEQGLTDNAIIEKVKLNKQYLYQLKKKWNIDDIQPVTADRKPSETHNTKEDKTAEYERLIKELQGKLADANSDSATKDNLIKELEAKIEQHEHIDAACDDVEDEAATFKKERDNYLDQLLDTRHKLIEKDYIAENQKKRIEDLRKTTILYAKENKALRELVSLWI